MAHRPRRPGLTALSGSSSEREWIDALFSEPPHYRSDAEREEIEANDSAPQAIALNRQR